MFLFAVSLIFFRTRSAAGRGRHAAIGARPCRGSFAMGGRRKAGAVLYRSTGGRRNKTLARGDCLVFVPSGAAPGLEEASEAIELNGISRKSREDQLADILRMVDKDRVQDRALLALFSRTLSQLSLSLFFFCLQSSAAQRSAVQ